MLDGTTFQNVIQGGSFAMVVAIVGWALYWTPRWVAAYWLSRDREYESHVAVARERSASDKEVARVFSESLDRATTTHAAVQDRTLKAMQSEAEREREVCERRHKELVELHRMFHAENGAMHQQTRHHLNNLAQAAEFHKQIIDGLKLLRSEGREPDMEGGLRRTDGGQG